MVLCKKVAKLKYFKYCDNHLLIHFRTIKLLLYRPYILKLIFLFNFYPTAVKGCQDIVFMYGIQMGRWTVEKVSSGCISETVRYRKLILGRDIDWGSVSVNVKG